MAKKNAELPAPPEQIDPKHPPKVLYLLGRKFVRLKPEARGQLPQYAATELLAERNLVFRFQMLVDHSRKVTTYDYYCAVFLYEQTPGLPIMQAGRRARTPARAASKAWAEFETLAVAMRERCRREIDRYTNRMRRLDLEVLPLFPKRRGAKK